MSSPRLSVEQVIKDLKKLYPKAKCTLDWQAPLDLLVATILSAQCTDKRVNTVTKSLFKKYKTAQDYVDVSIKELENDIHSCGTFHVKAVSIQESCKILIKEFDSEPPKTMEGMIKLKGVGRKTGAVVLGTAYGVIEGIPIDTHNIRLIHRLGLSEKKTQSAIEKEMMKKTEQKHWAALSHLLIAHGRAICTARNPACEKCMFAHTCPSSTVRKRKS